MLGSSVLAPAPVAAMLVEFDDPHRGALPASVDPFERAMADIRAAAPATDADRSGLVIEPI